MYMDKYYTSPQLANYLLTKINVDKKSDVTDSDAEFKTYDNS